MYEKKKFLEKRKKKSSWTDSQFFALSTVNAYSKNLKLSPFNQSIRNKYLFYVKQIKKKFQN
jgi:hypothetical protein